MVRAYIGLGANLGDPAAQLRAALAGIAALPQTSMTACSQFYRSPPMGPPAQPDYCNAVCEVETGLAPRTMLEELLRLERTAGRQRGADRWGPRVLDLDLLHVEGIAVDEPNLRLPHRGLAHRAFVLRPLAEIAPALIVPGIGAVRELADRIDGEGLRFWEAA